MKEIEQQLIIDYLTRILHANEMINVTSITDYDEAMLLHVEDSLAALQELEEAPDGLYGDMGSGGGFPGVPLGIAGNRQTILIDSVKKKMMMVEEILKELGVDERIAVYAGRLEEYPQDAPRFSVMTARALSSLPTLMELAAPLLEMKGHLICMKANIDEDEIRQAESIEYLIGMKLVKDRSYFLSDSKTRRRILVFEKADEPGISLPRRVGVAQKRPLKK